MSALKKIVIFGAGGLAKEIKALIDHINEHETCMQLIAFVVDDQWLNQDQSIHNIPIFDRSWLVKHKDDVECVCGIGYPNERKKVCISLQNEGIRFANVIHPNVMIEEGSSLGQGCILQSGVGISLDVSVGNFVFLNSGVTVGHDVVLGDFVSCFPKAQISGSVKIGEGASVGSMSFVNEHLRIGEGAVIAPGSIVFANVKPYSHVIGNPARRIEL